MTTATPPPVVTSPVVTSPVATSPVTLKSIRSAALLVCTYRRPQSLARLIQSAAKLELPQGLALEIVIADNNPESHWDDNIKAAVSSLAWPVHYGHEPVAGYSSARNKALEVARDKTDAGILLFVDDDMILHPGWLAGHLKSHEEFGCDVVNGRIYGVRERFEHGAKLEKCGAGNVSFNRRLVEAEDKGGMGLRFDPTFNKLGSEDQDFFRRAVAGGADIRQSDHPLIYNYYGETAVPEEEVINKMYTTAAMQQNLVAKARNEQGYWPALALALGGTVFGLKAFGQASLMGVWMFAFQRARARKAQLSALKEYLKMRARFAGLSGEIVARQDVRRQDPV